MVKYHSHIDSNSNTNLSMAKKNKGLVIEFFRILKREFWCKNFQWCYFYRTIDSIGGIFILTGVSFLFSIFTKTKHQ